MDLVSLHFDAIWLKIYLLTNAVILCFCYSALLILLTFSPSLRVLLLAMSLCWLDTHMLKFSLLETSVYTILTDSDPLTLLLGELKLFISLILFSKTQLSSQSSLDPFQISLYNLYSHYVAVSLYLLQHKRIYCKAHGSWISSLWCSLA